MPRVFHTVGGLYERFGGPSRTVPFLCNALARSGTAIDLVCQTFKSEPSDLCHLVDKSISLSFVDAFDPWARGLLSSPRFERELVHRYRHGEGELIHDHGAWAGSNHAAATVARKLRVPLVSSPRGMLLDWSLRHRAFRKKLALILYQRNDLHTVSCFLATSMEEADELRRLNIRKPIAIIPNGVLIPARSDSVPAPVPRANGGGARVALFLSRLHPKKGVHDLIDAWARLRPTGWELWIAGPDEGGYRARLEAMVDDLSLRGSCRFLGPVSESDKWQVYRQADVFVLPTYSENFGVTVAEALACSVPVITTTAAPWQVLIQERCGWWIEPGLDALTEALREAMEISDEDRRESGDRGKRYVIENLSWDRVAESTRACYEWLLGRADRPACVVD